MRNETLNFTGPFEKHINNYLKEQELVGHKIDGYVYILKSFDTFSQNYDNNVNYLTKDMVIKWLEPRIYEKENNISHRASKIRQFGKYMNFQDNKSYVLPDRLYNFNIKHTAYIFSHEEINNFFYKVDQMVINKPNSYKEHSSQIIFRLLYMCGLRISEALNIRLKDLNTDEMTIKIYNAKNNKDRIIAINEELTNLIVNYIDKFHTYSDNTIFLFKSKRNKPFSRFTIYERFRNILNKCNIRHTAKGPRMHDFRHTFCVHCLKKWTLENKNLMAYLPILKTYLGHETFRETSYYLKLTADIYPNITTRIEKEYNQLIPILEEENEK